jgi:aspartokinase
VIAIVGEKMKGTVGIASRLFGSLSQSQINILTIVQGSSEHNISLVIAQEDVDRAVRAVHEVFQLGSKPEYD